MFGMGFAEILIIGVIAILFLGPDKLPQAMVDIAKFFRSAKRTIMSAKDSLEEELHISDLKEEAMSYKNDIMSASSELNRLTALDTLNDELDDVKKAVKADSPNETKKRPETASEPEVITFEKKKKKSVKLPKIEDAVNVEPSKKEEN
ncbi:MAG: Sec-independent protein translocase TatB [Epsilonproteobacteria bacterium]|nr:MAG: Sec-independent protein translocase TatB [Campylobacterota bacterium]